MTTHTPAELAKLADNLWKAQQKLKIAKAKLKPQEDTVAALETELLEAMMAAKLESLASKNATISIKRNTFAELFDDRAFFAYVGKNKAWDLVAKRPTSPACAPARASTSRSPRATSNDSDPGTAAVLRLYS
jgi:hypothetical protein